VVASALSGLLLRVERAPRMVIGAVVLFMEPDWRHCRSLGGFCQNSRKGTSLSICQRSQDLAPGVAALDAR